MYLDGGFNKTSTSIYIVRIQRNIHQENNKREIQLPLKKDNLSESKIGKLPYISQF